MAPGKVTTPEIISNWMVLEVLPGALVDLAFSFLTLFPQQGTHRPLLYMLLLQHRRIILPNGENEYLIIKMFPKCVRKITSTDDFQGKYVLDG